MEFLLNKLINDKYINIVTILEGGEFVWGFPTKCGGINRGDILRVPQAPRDVPSVVPEDKSIGITFWVWTMIPRGGHSYTRHP